MTEIKDIILTKGDTFSFAIEFEGLDQELTNIYFSCKEETSSRVYIFQKSLNNGVTKINNSTYRVRVAPEDTKNIESGSYFYDLQISANGDVFTILKGKFIVEYEITEES